MPARWVKLTPLDVGFDLEQGPKTLTYFWGVSWSTVKPERKKKVMSCNLALFRLKSFVSWKLHCKTSFVMFVYRPTGVTSETIQNWHPAQDTVNWRSGQRMSALFALAPGKTWWWLDFQVMPFLDECEALLEWYHVLVKSYFHPHSCDPQVMYHFGAFSEHLHCFGSCFCSILTYRLNYLTTQVGEKCGEKSRVWLGGWMHEMLTHVLTYVGVGKARPELSFWNRKLIHRQMHCGLSSSH